MTAQGDAIRRAVTRPVAAISLGWLVVISLACACAGWLSPHDPLAQDLSTTLSGPTSEYWLGTDDLGRDVLSRLLHGGSGLLVTALIPVGVSVLIGVPVGLLAGYLRGPVDTLANFAADVLFAMPGLVVVLAVAAVTDNNITLMAIVFGVLTSGVTYRVARNATAGARSMPYVDAALVSRLPRRRILARHILPNLAGPLTVQTFIQYSGTFLFLTSLSFLGLGFSPETPSWGQLTLTAAHNMYVNPWMMVPVGFALTSTVLALNLVGFAILRGLTGHRRPRSAPRPRKDRRAAHANADASPATRPLRLADGDIANQSALVIEDLQIAFGAADEALAVAGVSLAVRKGEAFGLVGESGSGKTTTALAVLGLVPPPGRVLAGQILLDGQDLLALGESGLREVRRHKIGLISQEPMVALDPCFTVGSQLRELLRLRRGLSRKAASRTARDLLREVGLRTPDVVATQYPHQLSGGIAQRVSIALALSGEPQILVADEPTTALDVTVQAEILDLLRRLQSERSMTLLLVSHDLGVVADLCDRVAVMADGRIVEEGTTEKVLTAPEHAYSRQLIQATPRLNDSNEITSLGRERKAT
ncbi:ATP-binding cassette domain-containing protein [Nocardioides immobilis]|uniref:ATP-binding cassette domain-containing protein n=1 Tax=Nocardioides immobilis TaxID=2049295 RepID=A0A417XUW9_9ACTN|nr:dipeptide/oligopeptide/nickel ABC transporter permease/ATP-binding protein [Nocardioides immobilis]RHW24085.1 ATP-binding cassette domain-containing protein [Nocardioides immobilis]